MRPLTGTDGCAFPQKFTARCLADNLGKEVPMQLDDGADLRPRHRELAVNLEYFCLVSLAELTQQPVAPGLEQFSRA